MTTKKIQLIETIEAMRKQEQIYHVTDYLSRLPKTSIALDENSPVDENCRILMSNWTVQIAMTCEYKQETVEIAMNCLDRFMATPIGEKEILLDRNLFQLAAMTALYSSVKIHEQEVMDTQLLSALSHGNHSPQDVEKMERKMLTAINWRVNPPTIMSFVRMIIEFIPKDRLNAEEKQILLDLTEEQVVAVANEYDLALFEASHIALASLLNSIERCFDAKNEGGMLFCSHFSMAINQLLQIDDCTCISRLQTRIYKQTNKSYGGDHYDEDYTISHDEVTKPIESLFSKSVSKSNITQSRRRSPQSVKDFSCSSSIIKIIYNEEQ